LFTQEEIIDKVTNEFLPVIKQQIWTTIGANTNTVFTVDTVKSVTDAVLNTMMTSATSEPERLLLKAIKAGVAADFITWFGFVEASFTFGTMANYQIKPGVTFYRFTSAPS